MRHGVPPHPETHRKNHVCAHAMHCGRFHSPWDALNRVTGLRAERGRARKQGGPSCTITFLFRSAKLKFEPCAAERTENVYRRTIKLGLPALLAHGRGCGCRGRFPLLLWLQQLKMGKKEQLVVISFVSVTTVVVGKWIIDSPFFSTCFSRQDSGTCRNVGAAIEGRQMHSCCCAQLATAAPTKPRNINTVSYCCTAVPSDKLRRDAYLDREVA